jgi:hypothetical protein
MAKSNSKSIDSSGVGMTLLPCAPDVCQECAVDHEPANAHNQQSLYYQYTFYAVHGRWPTWTDAIAHCHTHIQGQWVKALADRGVVAKVTPWYEWLLQNGGILPGRILVGEPGGATALAAHQQTGWTFVTATTVDELEAKLRQLGVVPSWEQPRQKPEGSHV